MSAGCSAARAHNARRDRRRRSARSFLICGSITTAANSQARSWPGHMRGRSLGEFDLRQLTAMISGFDAESVALLESYLDRRFPAWRQDAQGNAAGGRRRPAAAVK